jgi:hypothetical protein
VVPDHGFDWAFDEFWSRRLPAPPSSMAQPSGFAGVRLEPWEEFVNRP